MRLHKRNGFLSFMLGLLFLTASSLANAQQPLDINAEIKALKERINKLEQMQIQQQLQQQMQVEEEEKPSVYFGAFGSMEYENFADEERNEFDGHRIELFFGGCPANFQAFYDQAKGGDKTLS